IIPPTDPTSVARINQARERQALSDVSPGQIWLQWWHRLIGAIVGLTILGFWLWVRQQKYVPPALTKLSSLWVTLVIVQIALGGWTILSNKAADIATAHVAFGAITFAVGIAISALLIHSRHCGRLLSLDSANSQVAEVAA